jgi:hypothetical protein
MYMHLAKKLLASLIPVGLLSAMALSAVMVVPTPVLAYSYEHVYCSQYLGVNGTCPPNGSSEYAHLELNLGDAGGESHETCVDDYLTETGYTGASCMYYSGEVASIITSGQYGYPRAWNGGKVEHFVYGEEYGYHTSADAMTSPMTSVGTNAQSLPAAAVRSLSVMPGLDPSAAVFIGGTYPVWVVPGSTAVCLIDAAMGTPSVLGGVCGTTSAAEERGLAVTTENASGTPIVLGLAPRGNTSVKVTNSNGTTENVPVTSGVYEITGGSPSTASLKEASGKETTRHLPELSRPPASAPAGSPTP